MTHTKGPWKYRTCGKSESTGKYIASGIWHITDLDASISEANAHLIAAAPDLLEALDEIVNAADGDGWNSLDPLLTKARSSIAKARGQS